jgi:hypothetical protein
VDKNHASIHFTISKGHKILITINLCYNVLCRNGCDTAQKKRNIPLTHTVEQNLTLTSLKIKFVLAYDHLKSHSNGTVQVISKCLQVT